MEYNQAGKSQYSNFPREWDMQCGHKVKVRSPKLQDWKAGTNGMRLHEHKKNRFML
jgi:hypothetical protein